MSAPTTTKTAQTLLDRHAKLREAHAAAFAAVETADAPDANLTAKRDAAFAKLAPVAAKLRERGYTLEHDDSAPVPPAAPAAPVRKPAVTRDQLEAAAKLRAEGATWNEIRQATGTKLGSTAWFRYWEREGIDAPPAHSDEFKAARAERAGRADRPQPEGQAKPAEGASAKPSRAAKKPPEGEAKPRRTVRRSKSAA